MKEDIEKQTNTKHVSTECYESETFVYKKQQISEQAYPKKRH